MNVSTKESISGVNGSLAGFTANNATLSYDVEVENAVMFSIGLNYKF